MAGQYDLKPERGMRPIRLRPRAEIGLANPMGESGDDDVTGPGGPSMAGARQYALRAEGKPKGTEGVKSAEPLAGGRISQRYPKERKGGGWEGKENPLTENLLINMNVLRQDPAKMQQAADIIAAYPNMTKAMLEMNPSDRLNAFRDMMVGNYHALWDLMGPAGQGRASNWYLGANRIANERANEIGVPVEAMAGGYAGLSPQKDWFQNVYLGDQTARILSLNPKVTPEMMRRAETIKPYTEVEAKDMLGALEGRRILNMDPLEQAMAIRLYDETYGPVGSNTGERAYRKISPEGEYGDFTTTKGGDLRRPAWGSFNEISKAAQSIQSGGDMSLISPLMGEKHKVRNFFNNIVAPIEGEPFGDITVDTHQIGAGLFRPLTGKTPEVTQGLQSGAKDIPSAPQSAVTGLQGLYPVYADATRQAAAERDVPVRAMQSVPWEATRSLFPPEFRTAKNMNTIDDIWRAHGRGEISADEARRQIVNVAGGFRTPAW